VVGRGGDEKLRGRFKSEQLDPLDELIGDSQGIVAVREKIGRLLQRQSDSRRLPTILIQGETGTGKGLLARAIHRAGPRATGSFVAVSCAAIPETLLEAELFGFERGAFTDARQAKPGLFQAAHRGTLFLDEVGLLPEGLQGKLLTVLEEREVRRLGSTRSEPVDVWILAATSADLEAGTRARRFREDLYHRLAVLTLWLPPLRERGRDILLLAEHFLARACADYSLPPKSLAPDARAALQTYRWPGNIRELSNVLERVALLVEAPVVTAEMLGLPETPVAELREIARAGDSISLKDAVGSVEREHLLEVLRQTNWNISRAAARLGVPRNTLRYRIQKHGLSPGGSETRPRQRAARPPAVSARVPPEVPAPTGVRWERRRLTLLRAVLVSPRGESSSLDSSQQLEVLLEKVQSFGGRLQELSPTGVVAAFGLEPVEDAPTRAGLAAIAIQKAVERAQSGDADRVAVMVGIHTGQFEVGRVSGAAEIALEAKREAWTVRRVGEARPAGCHLGQRGHRVVPGAALRPRAGGPPGAGPGARLPSCGARTHRAWPRGTDGEVRRAASRAGGAAEPVGLRHARTRPGGRNRGRGRDRQISPPLRVPAEPGRGSAHLS
jgi:DNA-binding NtrC family response regulator